ncbi:DISARM system helicase DrmA [Clostridium pasteurianum]|uniref:Helicase family protein n=1 Tax=Clostridium pasteurianum BC1 TaxID=86416 RepID=R4K3G9_CLOPA|nr:DISARM system helicase DrmA [Clostridium pasteurianum]AGK97123.1 helicase family protein [Clostridium pasteurianum BC1]
MSDKAYSAVRNKILEALRIDLMGPLEEKEKLDESPLSSYITGMLYPHKTSISPDVEYENEDFTSIRDEDCGEEEEDEVEEIIGTKFKLQSSMGIRFYVNNNIQKLKVKVKWGQYYKDKLKPENDNNDEKKKKSGRTVFIRVPKEEEIILDLASTNKNTELLLKQDPSIKIKSSQILLKSGAKLVAVYLSNCRETSDDRDFENVMFQAELIVKGFNNEPVFEPEHLCRDIEIEDEFYYEKRPIYARGNGCATDWVKSDGEKAEEVRTIFIPEHEISSVSPNLKGFSEDYFSMQFMCKSSNRAEIICRLKALNDEYFKWIDNLKKNIKMQNDDFKDRGNKIINKCFEAHKRISLGIEQIEKNDYAFKAFCFMNQSMYLQRGMSEFSKKYGSGIKCSFRDEEFCKKDHSKWRPFQIAFILLNLTGCLDPLNNERKNVDLLYFPTGGGKTEAYLGLIAFVIGYRRLTAHLEKEYEKDGGVTVILRYTLRLLTTQQRDRLTKMICAAEIIRGKHEADYGKTPISIGFWVGGGVTPNSFNEFKDNKDDPTASNKAKNKLTKQIITCPFCGSPINKEDYDIDTEKGEVNIYCHDSNCYFYKFKGKSIPVYVVDEEIYRKCPTVIISTVDKFARLPWDEKTGLIFGRADRYCERHGYIACGEKHTNRHNKKGNLSAAKIIETRQFYPPELIVQDELHLITGPLGTIYGGYETVIEEMCSFTRNGHKILPKYIVSTATIKNANEQIKCLYGRVEFTQFPPSGFDIGDSYFIKEISLDEKPFRKYCAVCASGQSMKTTVLRIYAVLLQSVLELSRQEEYIDLIDPYYTLIGYFNSIRELGGTVRLLQDDIPKRIKRIKKRYGYSQERFLKRTREITSRISSYKIAELLEQLTLSHDDEECLDVAIATNMIAVGMDVDRLGLMTVMGQPKQNSEYIQATSRIGRKFPGLVVTIYNPYRPRDLSHYENFKGFHSHMYRYVEGTTATPFSARARDRVLHAIIVALLRLKNEKMANNNGANNICNIENEIIEEAKKVIVDRISIISPKAKDDSSSEIEQFIEDWKCLTSEEKELLYYIKYTEKYNRLLNYYNEYCTPKEKPTLNSMREVESSSSLYYFTEEAKKHENK